MKIVKNNLPLAVYAIKEKIETPYATLIISPAFELTAREIFSYFIRDVLELKINEKKDFIKKSD